MIVFLLGFSKKKNSTIKPVLTGAVQLTCQLKEETSVVNPTIIINPNNAVFTSPFTPSAYNYAYIPQFQRYYFINDWRYNVATWEAFLNVDVLASFKESIALETCYIERAYSAYNSNIIDKIYPTKTDIDITRVNLSSTWSGVSPSGGCYILGIINYQTGGRRGAVSYYACTEQELNDLMTFLFSNNIYNASSITEIGEGLFKSLFNPFQYIVSCMWMPGSSDAYTSSFIRTSMRIGYWDTQISAYVMDTTGRSFSIYGTVPDHPQSSSRGEYLNYNPYTRLMFYCPPFGSFEIDATYMRKGKCMYSQVLADPVTGQGTLRVSFSENSSQGYSQYPCIEKTALMGVQIQLAQVLSDYSNSIGMIQGGMSGGLVGAISGAIGATIMSSLEARSPKVSTAGANGSFLNYGLEPILTVEHYKLVDEDRINLGRPLMSARQINTLSGYIKCVEAHYSGVCFDSEKELINQFMISGFYYE